MLVCGQTEKAYKVKVDGQVKWLPKSQCWEDGQILHIKEWLANKNGFPAKHKLTDAEYVDYFGGSLEKKTSDLNQDHLAYISTIFKPNEKQEEALKKCNLASGFLYALKQGVGKTKLCLDEISILNSEHVIDTVLVITPNGVKYGWLKEIKKHFLPIDEYEYYVWDSNKKKAELNKQADFLNSDKKRFLIINYESVLAPRGSKFIKEVMKGTNKVFCALDEVHKILNRKSKIGEWFRENRNIFLYRRGMSGTAIKKHAKDLWNIMKFLAWPCFPDTYWKFAEEYFYIDKMTGFGWEVLSFKKDKKEKYLNDIDPYYAYGELNNSVAMPDKLITVDMSSLAIQQSIELLQDGLNNAMGVGFKDDEIEDEANQYEYTLLEKLSTYAQRYKAHLYKEDRGYLIKLRQLASSIIGNREAYTVLTNNGDYTDIPKCNTLLSELEDVDLEEDKVIICGTQIPLLTETCKALKAAGYKFEYIDGTVTGLDRENALNRFEGNTNILVANYKTISTGLNLQHANRMMFLDIDFESDELDQMRKRIDRQGQEKPCYYTFLLAQYSIDWAIYTSNQKKLKVQKTVLDIKKID